MLKSPNLISNDKVSLSKPSLFKPMDLGLVKFVQRQLVLCHYAHFFCQQSTILNFTFWSIEFIILLLAALTSALSIVQAGAKVNISAGGATPLHIAADHGSLEIINCLLKAGADPNVIDEVRPQLSSVNYIKYFFFFLFLWRKNRGLLH